MAEWEPIRRGKPEPAPEVGGEGIIITVPLEEMPPLEWQRIFNSPSGLISTACTASVEGRTIMATSTLGQLRACVEHVDRLIDHANERYASVVLPAQAEERQSAQRMTDELEGRQKAARDELEGL
jgi:hypothetical protein